MTSASVVLTSDTSGSVTVTVPSGTSIGTTTLTLPTSGGTIQTSGAGFTTNGVAYASSTSALTTGSALSFSGTQLSITGTTSNIINQLTGTTSAVYMACSNTSSTFYIGKDNSTGSGFGTTAYASVLYESGAYPMVFFTSAVERGRFNATGYFQAAGASGSYPDGSNLSYHYFNSNTSGAGASDRVFRIRANNTSFAGFVFEAFGAGTTTNSTYTVAAFTNGNSTGVCYIRDSGNVVNTNNSYGSSSDVRLKENIVDATPKLNDLLNVKVRNYNLKIKPNEKHIGVIAQELETVFPGLVEEDNEGIKGVKYSVFVPMLIKSIQELSTLITAQQSTIQSLTERITALENK